MLFEFLKCLLLVASKEPFCPIYCQRVFVLLFGVQEYSHVYFGMKSFLNVKTITCNVI